jgi:hypothetical protein
MALKPARPCFEDSIVHAASKELPPCSQNNLPGSWALDNPSACLYLQTLYSEKESKRADGRDMGQADRDETSALCNFNRGPQYQGNNLTTLLHIFAIRKTLRREQRSSWIRDSIEDTHELDLGHVTATTLPRSLIWGIGFKSFDRSA